MNDAVTPPAAPTDAGGYDDMANDPGQERAQANTIRRLVDAGKRSRKDFAEIAKKVWDFAYSRNYDWLFKDFPAELSFKSKINRAGEFIEICGPYLYPQNPVATTTPAKSARYWQRQRATVEADLINYELRESYFEREARPWIDEALGPGRGVLWTGWDPKKRINVSVFDTWSNYLEDPDARVRRDIKWQARRRLIPRWQLMRDYPEKKAQIALLERTSERPSDGHSEAKEVSELIEVYEMYLVVGLHNYLPSMAKPDETGEVDDSPKKYVMAGETILSCTTWEIPFFLDGEWPGTPLDLRNRPGSTWPMSPLEGGLGHIEALNWIFSTYISKVHVASRTPICVARYNGQGIDDAELVKLLHGPDMSIVRISINGNEYKLSDIVQQFKFDTGIDELDRFVTLVNREFEKATGLDEFLYAGNTARQARSATEIETRKEQSTHRIDDFLVQTKETLSRLMRKVAFANRYLMTPEDITRLLGPEAGKAWGVLASPEEVAQEQAMRAQMRQQLEQQAAMQQQQALMMTQQAAAMGQVPPPPPPVPTPDDIEKQLGPEQLVSMDEWITEASREIESGSMRRMDQEAKLENLNVALNQLAPAVVAMPGGAEFVAAVALEFVKENRYSPELQQAAAQFYKMASSANLPPSPAGAPGTMASKAPEPDTRTTAPSA